MPQKTTKTRPWSQLAPEVFAPGAPAGSGPTELLASWLPLAELSMGSWRVFWAGAGPLNGCVFLWCPVQSDQEGVPSEITDPVRPILFLCVFFPGRIWREVPLVFETELCMCCLVSICARVDVKVRIQDQTYVSSMFLSIICPRALVSFVVNNATQLELSTACTRISVGLVCNCNQSFCTHTHTHTRLCFLITHPHNCFCRSSWKQAGRVNYLY